MQLQNKKLSFNNVTNTNTTLKYMKNFVKPTYIIIKHTNPCNMTIIPKDKNNIHKTYNLTYTTNTKSTFNNIITFNHKLNNETTKTIVEHLQQQH